MLIRKQIQKAIKVNNYIKKYSKKPHERDTARMRINILRKKLGELK